MSEVTHLVIGPREHGVVIFADWLARSTGGRRVFLADPQNLEPEGIRRAHVHYTEALFGPDARAAAAAFLRMRANLPVPLSVTLHDLPDPGDEPSRYRRRADGFRAVAEAADAVFVNSRHELGLLQTFAKLVVAQVVPLPMVAGSPIEAQQRPRPLRQAAVFGFLYPGKGHEELLEEMRELPTDLGLTAIGRPAEGHDGLIAHLSSRAAQSGRGFEVTGYVPQEDLLKRLRQVALPVVPAPNISASGSLNSWIAAGRRPLVAAGPYSRELAEACPGLVNLYRPGSFAESARAVLAEPARSWLEVGPPTDRHEASVAAAYAQALEPSRPGPVLSR
ncbi:glycosyltransferase family protein [Kineosporia babensis]|uniref:Glycosyltransferase n=1 Tax=Kineosporia babensis TaxID=499548 RepID=A0A9X1NB81_9ACTN|nr:hypothetical protein [Kineosporia babensis]MCD5310515.1 hypothetical protein [Kineosporia babensis]